MDEDQASSRKQDHVPCDSGDASFLVKCVTQQLAMLLRHLGVPLRAEPLQQPRRQLDPLQLRVPDEDPENACDGPALASRGCHAGLCSANAKVSSAVMASPCSQAAENASSVSAALAFAIELSRIWTSCASR